ncbi:hypothetical protein LJR130_006783 [Variovorax sp. LjRoot130]
MVSDEREIIGDRAAQLTCLLLRRDLSFGLGQAFEARCVRTNLRGELLRAQAGTRHRLAHPLDRLACCVRRAGAARLLGLDEDQIAMALGLITTTGNNMSPALYLVGIAVMGLMGGLMLPETAKISLHDAGTAYPDATTAAKLKDVPEPAA